ncbi:hypothetical protein CQW23_01041 [Capsicum baccatum]|uniref:Uncharacterized protein n=1 Tax=Capsicum baccatum TaxID=33114 RepID=A0A2G2XMG0_CAPBA|nr:hypothetical protein CQW23_01041 [Capsicum baccatum]
MLIDIPLWGKPIPPLTIFCDNKADIFWASSDYYNGKSRQVRLKHNHVRILLEDGIISLQYVKSKLNLVDPLSKGLGKELVVQTCNGMRINPVVGTIARTPAASTSQPMDNNATNVILAYLDTMSRDLPMENERLDHMEQLGVVATLPRVEVLEFTFCDTLGSIRSHEDQTLVVGTQALVDLLDDEIDSPRENDLYPSSASTYNLTKVPLPSGESIDTLVNPCEKQGESTLVYKLPTTSENMDNDQSSGKDLDVLDCLGNPNCDCLGKNGFSCDPLGTRGGLCVSEDCSFEREGDVCLEIPSTSSLSVSYVGHISSGDFETSSKCMHENPLFEVGLWNTFLNLLFVHDISNDDKEGFLNLDMAP